MAENGMTAADVGAVMNNRGGNGWGDSWYGIIGLMVVAGMFGGFGGWGNNRGGGDVLTTAESCNMNSFNELKSQVGRMNDMMFQEARTSDNAICTLGYQSLEQTNAIERQIADCCCTLRQEIQAEANATRNMIQQDKIERMQQRINSLEMDQRFCGVPRLPLDFTYAVTPNFCGSTTTTPTTL